MTAFTLTERQREIYEFIDEALMSTGTAPSVGEIATAFDTVKSNIVRHLNCLEQRGAIRRIPGHARSITVCGDVGGNSDVQARAEKLLARWYGAGVINGYPTTAMLRDLVGIVG